MRPAGASWSPWKTDPALCPHLLEPLSLPLLHLAGHVRFIDYEYAGYNYQAFDIGNHFNEFAGEEGIGAWPASRTPCA